MISYLLIAGRGDEQSYHSFNAGRYTNFGRMYTRPCVLHGRIMMPRHNLHITLRRITCLDESFFLNNKIYLEKTFHFMRKTIFIQGLKRMTIAAIVLSLSTAIYSCNDSAKRSGTEATSGDSVDPGTIPSDTPILVTPDTTIANPLDTSAKSKQ